MSGPLIIAGYAVIIAGAAYYFIGKRIAAQHTANLLGMLGIMLKAGVKIDRALIALASEASTRMLARIT